MKPERLDPISAAGHLAKACLWFGVAVVLFPVALALTVVEEVRR